MKTEMKFLPLSEGSREMCNRFPLTFFILKRQLLKQNKDYDVSVYTPTSFQPWHLESEDLVRICSNGFRMQVYMTCIILSRGEESHDKDWVINARRVDLLWPESSAKQRENPQGCSGVDSALFLLLQCSESVLCFSGCCSVTRCYLWEKRDGKWVLSLMEKSPHVLGLRGLCSHPMTSRRCDRSACD